MVSCDPGLGEGSSVSIEVKTCEMGSESNWPRIVTCMRYDDDRAFRSAFCSDCPSPFEVRQKPVRFWHRLFGCPIVVIGGYVFTKCDCGAWE